MRTKVFKLADGADYTASTFTMREMRDLRDLQDKVDDIQRELDVANKNLESNPTNTDMRAKVRELENQMFNNSMEFVRASLAKKHDKFRPDENGSKEAAYDILLDLIDSHDLQDITSFATGTEVSVPGFRS